MKLLFTSMRDPLLFAYLYRSPSLLFLFHRAKCFPFSETFYIKAKNKKAVLFRFILFLYLTFSFVVIYLSVYIHFLLFRILKIGFCLIHFVSVYI